MSSKIDSCLKNGFLEKVSSGEVCSLEVAKAIGIDDIIHNKYYTNDYASVKTFNTKIDTTENRSSFQLCDTNTSGTQSFSVCPLQKNVGFGFTQKYDTALKQNVCTTAECPTSFTEYKDTNGVVDDTKCVKPKQEKTVSMSGKIDERWHDWFVIPEYQLGNKYSSVDGKNYAPCNKGNVPNYSTDPVDGATSSYTGNDKITTNKCIDKTKYFSGKYKDSPSYSPLAWIMRAGATKEDLVKLYNSYIEEVEKLGNANEDLEIIKKNVANYIDTEIYNPIQQIGFKESANPPYLTEEDNYACKRLYADPKHLELPYEICKRIKETDQKIYLEQHNDDPTAIIKYMRTKEACHRVFCNDTDALSQLDGAQPICFPEVETQNIDAEIELAKQIRETEEATPIVDFNSPRISIIRSTIYWSVVFIAISGLLLFIYILWGGVIQPILLGIYKLLIFILFGTQSNRVALNEKYAPPK